MNPEELQQKIAEYYVRLPKKAQAVFASQRWVETLRKISERKELTQEQIQVLGTETTLVLLGIINRTEYEKILTEELKLPSEKLEIILEEINSSILNPILPELTDRYNKNIGLVQEDQVMELSLEDKVATSNLVKESADPRFENLPENIKKIITDSNYQQKLYVLGKDSGLTIAKITELENLVTETILGESSVEEFETRARSITELEESKLKLLISAINEGILKVVRGQVLGLENKAVEVEEEEDFIPIVIAPKPTPVPTPAPKTENTTKTPDLTIPELQPVSLADTLELEAPVISLRKVEEKVIGKEEINTQPQPVSVPATPTPLRHNVDSIVLKKLAGSVRSSGVVTQYSLNNNSKPETTGGVGASASTPKPDPYRMPIE